MTEKKGCKCGDPVANGFHGADACEPYKQEEAAPMRTKLEILDTIDALGFEVYRAERLAAEASDGPIVMPKGAFIESLKPFAEIALDLRDLIVKFTDGEDGNIIKAYIVGQLKLQKSDADWRATIVSRLITEIRNAGKAAAGACGCAEFDCILALGHRGMHTKKGQDPNDAKPGEGDPSECGRQDRRPEEGGPQD